MKSYYLVLLFCLSLLISCNISEELNYDSIALEQNEPSDEFIAVETISTSRDYSNFNSDLNSYFNERHRDPDLGHGNVVVQTDLGAMYIFDTEDGGYLFIVSLSEDMKIKLMSQDRARFSISTNEPLCYITDAELTRLYSNECHNNRNGSFSTKVISGYRMVEYEFGIAYFPSGPYESADVLQLNTKVDNGIVEFDQNNELINCGTATINRNVSVKLLKTSHNGRLQAPKLKITIN